jgi:hypothetical protein
VVPFVKVIPDDEDDSRPHVTLKFASIRPWLMSVPT